MNNPPSTTIPSSSTTTPPSGPSVAPTPPPAPNLTSSFKTVLDAAQNSGDIQVVDKIKELMNYTHRCKCIFNHNFFNFAQHPNKNTHLKNLIEIYEDMYKRNQENFMSSLMCICKPCLFVIYGLLNTPCVRPIADTNCYASSNNPTNKYYDMGNFLQAHSSYDVDVNVYSHMKNAITAAFHQGIIVLGAPKLMAQTLAMSPHVVMDGLKVIQLCKYNADFKFVAYDDMEKALEKYKEFLEKFSDDNFYNGYYILDNDKYKYSLPKNKNDIEVKIFDLNVNFSQHYNQLVQTQRYLSNHGPVNNENIAAKILHSGSGDYLAKSNSSYNSLSEARVYDILSYALAFMTDDDYELLKDLPPFNGNCIVTSTNILVIDHQGRALFSYQDPADKTCAGNMKRAIKKQRVAVATTATPSLTRTLPAPHLDRSKLETTVAPVNTVARNQLLLDKHKSEVEKYRKMLKEKKEELQRYFVEFHDDDNEKVNVEKIYPILDQAMQMYPQEILHTVDSPYAEPMQQSLDYTLKQQKYYTADKNAQPNMVYVKHLGFVSLNRICQQTHLVLKNTKVLLENVMRRKAGLLEFIKADTTTPHGGALTLTSHPPNVQITLNPPAIMTDPQADAINTLAGPNRALNKDAHYQEDPPNLAECIVPGFTDFSQKHTQNDKCQGLL